jgi:transcriptional regulator with XRE-family HTH domain
MPEPIAYTGKVEFRRSQGPPPVAVLNINQIVAHNLNRARRERAWSQEQLGERLGEYTGHAWSVASVSAAERSASNGRSRLFNANEIMAFACVFTLPISYFFLPPESGAASTEQFMAADPKDGSQDGDWNPPKAVSREHLAEAIEPFVPPETFVKPLQRLLAEFDISWTPATRARTTPIPDELKTKTEELLKLYEENGVSAEALERAFSAARATRPESRV